MCILIVLINKNKELEQRKLKGKPAGSSPYIGYLTVFMSFRSL